MLEILGHPAWQGVGVIVALLVSGTPLILTLKDRKEQAEMEMRERSKATVTATVAGVLKTDEEGNARYYSDAR